MKSFVKVTLALLLVATMMPIGEAEAARHRRGRRGGHHGGGCGNGGCYAPVYSGCANGSCHVQAPGKYSPMQKAPMQAPVQKGGY